MLMNTMPCRELSGHNRRAARRTNRIVDGELLKVDPFLRNPVKVGCLAERAAVYAQIPITPVIGEDEDNVRNLAYSPSCRFDCLSRCLYH